jgi:hypothetical protein
MRRLTFLILVLVPALALPATARADSVLVPLSYWSGINITGAKSIQRGLCYAHRYWRVTIPVTVTITTDPEPDVLARSELGTPDRPGSQIGLTLRALSDYPRTEPERSFTFPQIVVHEYGHLLGYLDDARYAQDPQHVMQDWARFMP